MEMPQNRADVNMNAPVMGSLCLLYARDAVMHVVGLDQIDTFLAGRARCQASGALRALAFELAKRTWKEPADMSRDYPSISFRHLPKVVFNLTPCAVTVDCQIDFRTGTVLVECCKPGTCPGEAQCRITWEDAA